MGRRLAAASSFVARWVLGALVGRRAAAAEPVRVDVILDMASIAGRRWRTSIRMAVDDYYAAHANSTTRVELRFRDSSGDAVAAVSAAVDLIRNAQVQAIIHWAHTDAEAEFVARIGGRAHVPVLSFSATPAAPPTPFSVGAADDDGSSQAAPVAGFLRNFRWRAAVLLHEDSPSGAAIAPALADAPRGAGASVAHRAAVPAGASDDRLDAVLYRVAAATTTRVLVVHMPLPQAMRLFRRAATAGMMSEGYVWIATAAVGLIRNAQVQAIIHGAQSAAAPFSVHAAADDFLKEDYILMKSDTFMLFLPVGKGFKKGEQVTGTSLAEDLSEM